MIKTGYLQETSLLFTYFATIQLQQQWLSKGDKRDKNTQLRHFFVSYSLSQLALPQIVIGSDPRGF